jgi:peptidyl-prolyl cis-trans isomerase C
MFVSTVQLRTVAALLTVVLATGGCASGAPSEGESNERASLTQSAERSKPDEEQKTEPQEQAQESAHTEGNAETAGRGASAAEEHGARDAGIPVEAIGPVAVIDGVEIGAEAFNELVARRTAGREKVPYRLARMHKERILNQVIEDFLVTRRLEQSNVEASEGDVEERYEEFRERFPNNEAFEEFKRRAGVTESRIKSDIRKAVKLETYVRENYDTEVTSSEARKYYDAHPGRFEHSDKVRARHILIKTSESMSEDALEAARKKAEKLAKRAKSGEDFAELAEVHSEGPSSKRGGDLGFFPRGRMVAAFDKASFALGKGEVSEPVKTQFGFHIIKVVDKKPAHTESFADARGSIVRKLERRALLREADVLIRELREEAKIVEKRDNILIRVEKPRDGQQARPEISPEVMQKIRKQMKQNQQGEE